LPVELARLQAWRSRLEVSGNSMAEVTRGGAATSGIVLSPERYVPSEGVLIQPPGKGASNDRAEEPSDRWS
jgi:hypothetical protein